MLIEYGYFFLLYSKHSCELYIKFDSIWYTLFSGINILSQCDVCWGTTLQVSFHMQQFLSKRNQFHQLQVTIKRLIVWPAVFPYVCRCMDVTCMLDYVHVCTCQYEASGVACEHVRGYWQGFDWLYRGFWLEHFVYYLLT